MTIEDRNINLIVKVDGKKVDDCGIVSLLEQMEYNEWNNITLLKIGNLELRLKRDKQDR